MPFAEPGVRPHYAPDRAVRIVHATIRISLEPVARTFSGLARLRLQAFPGYRGEIELDLDEVTVDAVTDGAGTALSFAHADGKLAVAADILPEELVVRWHGSDPRRGLYFVGPTPAEPNRPHTAWTQCQDEDAHFVFPCQDHPSVKHPWTLALDAPAGYTLLSNGKHGDTGERDGRVFSRFEQEEPMPAYLVTFVAAPLVAIEDRAPREGGDVPVRYLVPPGTEGDAGRAFGRTPAMIAHFAERTGVPYPWPRYDQVVVHDFVFGGMENVACTTMTDLLLVDEKAELEWEPDSLVSHELAHQWFGDLVTCQDWSQGWLNESWATYMEAVWWEHAHPAADATWYRWVTAGAYHAEASGRYRRPIVSYDFREPIDVFDRHLYNKGSCVLWTLRHQLGDEAFWGGVRHYLESHAHETVHTRHFQRALEEASGANLDGFFAQWVHAPGHPQLEVRLGKSPGPANGGTASDELVTVTVKQTQAADGVPQVFTFPLRLVLVSDDGRERTVDLLVDERERTWAVPTEGRIATVKVDPGYRVLAEIKLKGPEAWLERLLADVDPVLALRAARALLAEGSRRGLDAACKALREHPFHGLRGALAGEIGKLGTVVARDALVEALAAEKEPRARRAIAGALGAFREAAAADALLALLDEDLPTWQLEGQALVALGQTRDPRARAVLEARLLRPSWADVIRARALEGLAETEDAGVLDVLVAHTRDAHSDRTRSAASVALGRLADAVEDVRRPAVERLVEILVEPGFRTQLAAISALARAGDAKVEPALARLHRSAPDGRTRRSAYEALTRIRRGRTTEQGLAGLRRRLDELSEENARLRERVDKLER